MKIEYKDLIKKETKVKYLGEGPWVDESDYVEFEHCGMKCFVIRIAFPEGPNSEKIFGGHFCGYVELKESHPLYDKDLICDEENHFEIHGGVTHSEYHVFFEKYLVGFNCGHLFDFIPSEEKKYSELDELKEKLFPNGRVFDRFYKDINFVIEETKKLAEQLKEKETEMGKNE